MIVRGNKKATVNAVALLFSGFRTQIKQPAPDAVCPMPFAGQKKEGDFKMKSYRCNVDCLACQRLPKAKELSTRSVTALA